jgi:hypothetical protein
VRASLDLLGLSRARFVPEKARLVRVVVSLLAVSVAAVAIGPGAARSSRLATIPTIYVNYTTDCTFTMSVDGGIEITSPTAPGVVIPPGSYQVVISQAYALSPGAPRCPPSTYDLTGPGVSLSFVVGEGSPYEEATQTFAAASTFVAVVEDQPLVQLVFTTAATGSSASLLTPSQSPPAGKGQVQPGLVGSDVVPDRGTLRATVGTAGKATLTVHGKSVVSLEAGEYEIAVDDETARAGFTVRKLDQRPVEVSGASFVGKRTTKVDFTAGTWTFYSKATGARRFLVVA